MELIRLQKAMADAGIDSRRNCEKIITQGRVKVNGNVITELGFKVSNKDNIEVDGKLITKKEKKYYIMNKPDGYLPFINDNKNKRTVKLLLDENTINEGVFPFTDYDCQGALILSNDGELFNFLTKSKGINKTYQVRIDGKLTQEDLEKLMKGFTKGSLVCPRIKPNIIEINTQYKTTLLELSLKETKNLTPTLIFDALGYKIKKLKRLSIKGVEITGLKEGEYRELKPHEVKKLYAL